MLLNIILLLRWGKDTPSICCANLKTQYIRHSSNNRITVNFSVANNSYVKAGASVKQNSIKDSQRQDEEVKRELAAERLVWVTQVGHQVIDIKKVAVETAKLNFQTNQKNFSSDIRCTDDLLDIRHVFFQSINDDAVAVTQQVESHLNLLLIQAEDSAQAIKQVQASMFSN